MVHEGDERASLRRLTMDKVMTPTKNNPTENNPRAAEQVNPTGQCLV